MGNGAHSALSSAAGIAAQSPADVIDRIVPSSASRKSTLQERVSNEPCAECSNELLYGCHSPAGIGDIDRRVH
jgi:hypothetical protein